MVWEMKWWSVMRMFIWHTMPSEGFLSLSHSVFPMVEWIGKSVNVTTLCQTTWLWRNLMSPYFPKPQSLNNKRQFVVCWWLQTWIPTHVFLSHNKHKQAQVCHHNHSGVKCTLSGVKCLRTVVGLCIHKQKNTLWMALTLQTQQPFLEGTWLQPWFRRRNDMLCDMGHSDVNHLPWMWWMVWIGIKAKAN